MEQSMVLDNNEFDDKIEQIKTRLPQKLKVIAEAWNPVLELLALAFDGGKIMVKAIDRKTCWKKNINEEPGIVKNIWKISTLQQYEITSMTWSPDGEILAVSMSNSSIHMLTASTGKVGYTIHGKSSYEKLIWERIPQSNMNTLNEDFLSFACASSFNFNDEAPKECVQQIADMESFFHKQLSSFTSTVLIGIADEAILHLYLNASMFILSLDACDYYQIGDYADRTSLKVLDCMISDETKSLQALYQITEMNIQTQTIEANTFRIEYDLAWGRENLGPLLAIASSFFKINYLLIFLREMVRYTASGLEDNTEAFYQKVIRSFHFNYKTTLNAPWTFFHEMIQHLLGHNVSLAYFDSLRKGKSGIGGGPVHYPKMINEFNDKRLGSLFIGMRHVALATEAIMGLFKTIIDYYTTEFLSQAPKSVAHDDPEATRELKDLYSYYCDLVALQKLVENIRVIVDKKRRGFGLLANYLTQVNARHEDTFRGQPQTFYLENFKGSDFFDFIGESLVESDVRIPTSLLTPLVHRIPPQTKLNNQIAKNNLLQLISPIGCYPLPRYVSFCNSNCPHNSSFLQGKDEAVHFQPNPRLEEKFKNFGNLRKINPIASVYGWETEQYFDFFTKYFPEYGFAKYPPQSIIDVMNDKLKELLGNEANLASMKSLYGTEKHSFAYKVDEKEIMAKVILRPTVFLAIMPLFDFEAKIVNIMTVQYPAIITAKVAKPCPPSLSRLRRSNSDALKAVIDACLKIPDNTFGSRYDISSERAFELTEKFLAGALSLQ